MDNSNVSHPLLVASPVRPVVGYAPPKNGVGTEKCLSNALGAPLGARWGHSQYATNCSKEYSREVERERWVEPDYIRCLIQNEGAELVEVVTIHDPRPVRSRVYDGLDFGSKLEGWGHVPTRAPV